MIILICLYTKYKTRKYGSARNSEYARFHLELQVQGQFLGLILNLPRRVGSNDP